MAAVPFISNGDMGRSHMCRLLCYIICTDTVAYINDRQGRYMDHIFGLAKTAQYSAILILGKAGIERVKKYFSLRRRTT